MFAKYRVVETALLSFAWHLIGNTIAGAFVKCTSSGNRALEQDTMIPVAWERVSVLPT